MMKNHPHLVRMIFAAILAFGLMALDSYYGGKTIIFALLNKPIYLVIEHLCGSACHGMQYVQAAVTGYFSEAIACFVFIECTLILKKLLRR